MGLMTLIKTLINAKFDDQQATRYTIVPNPAATTFAVTMGTVTTNNGWDDWGTIDELIATTTEDYWVTHIYVVSATVTTYAQIQIGVGASASETWIQGIPVKISDANVMKIYTLPRPIFVASGSRIATRAQGSAATNFDVALGVASKLNRRT